MLCANIYLIESALFLAGILIGFWILSLRHRYSKRTIELNEQNVLEAARREAEAISREARLKANEDALKLREETENSFTARRQEIGQAEARLTEREKLINRQLEHLVEEEKHLRSQQEETRAKSAFLEQQQSELCFVLKQRKEQLESVSHLTETEARAQLLKEAEQQIQAEASALSRSILEGAKLRAEEKARWVISTAIQRYAGEHTFESTSATIALPGDEIKGRIIGREGRNIRAFEAATGVTVLIDDTPNAVVLSGFDPVRREIARESMHRLILDGRIHPTRIEEVVAKVQQEIDETIIHAGEDAVARAGLPPLHEEIAKLLGRLKFRHSFSQNVLEHSVEVAHLMGLMAGELGFDIQTAKRAGLLHDIGKAVSHEVEGAHALVGGDIIKRYGESEVIVNAVASHHYETPQTGPLGVLVSAADAISASRPGARSETMTTYIKRVEDLELLGMSFPGVEKVYAVQAGRELRVIVQPEQINDEQAYGLARSISRKIEEELQYPGQIRVTVIRETRCVELAK